MAVLTLMERKGFSRATVTTNALVRGKRDFQHWANTSREVQTSALASDTVGVLGNADPDGVFFLTKPFKDMRLVQVRQGQDISGTLAYMPTQQSGTYEDGYHKNGTPVTLDRAGFGSSSVNLIRTGSTPDGYYGNDKVIVEKRYKIYTINEDYPDMYVWGSNVQDEPHGYVLQQDERFDGNFYPGSINGGVDAPFGTSFPTDDQGNYLYCDSPYSDGGWNGTTFTVPSDESTRPVITGLSQDSFQLPKVGFEYYLEIYGSSFSGCGWVMIGPYKPDFSYESAIPASTPFIGAWAYRAVASDNLIRINMPASITAGSYYIYVIGSDGQIGVYPNLFQVLAAPDA